MPELAKDTEVIYIRDKNDENLLKKASQLKELGFEEDDHSKLPDVILYTKLKNWYYFVELGKKHEFIDESRRKELETLGQTEMKRVYISVFRDRAHFLECEDRIGTDARSENFIANERTIMRVIMGKDDRRLYPRPEYKESKGEDENAEA